MDGQRKGAETDKRGSAVWDKARHEEGVLGRSLWKSRRAAGGEGVKRADGGGGGAGAGVGGRSDHAVLGDEGVRQADGGGGAGGGAAAGGSSEIDGIREGRRTVKVEEELLGRGFESGFDAGV
eukprot:TRINITY_DN14364_c0_g1_i1.p1 TRINITY_DN14364_c0_g1~~TRINITY_DN14364_c0_g1_i1.p1  ORF type:complete len:123 (+),score=0.33 TRINITY_DN14364_c0_g1_i1:123-491(+)